MLDYTFATGGTSKIKKILEFLNEQEDVAKKIVDKYKNKEKYDNAV